VLNCLVLLKVRGVQKALTWVHDNAHVSFPTLPNDTFSNGALASLSDDSGSESSFLADPGSKATDKVTGAITRVIDYLDAAIRQEAIIASFILLLYAFICMCGVAAAFYRAHFTHQKNRGDGGSVVPRDNVTDFRSDDQDRFSNNAPVAPAANRHADPAPEYSEAVKAPARNPFDSPEADYQDEKLGLNHSPPRDEKRGGFI
jgi:hypothetical protein